MLKNQIADQKMFDELIEQLNKVPNEDQEALLAMTVACQLIRIANRLDSISDTLDVITVTDGAGALLVATRAAV